MQKNLCLGNLPKERWNHVQDEISQPLQNAQTPCKTEQKQRDMGQSPGQDRKGGLGHHCRHKCGPGTEEPGENSLEQGEGPQLEQGILPLLVTAEHTAQVARPESDPILPLRSPTEKLHGENPLKQMDSCCLPTELMADSPRAEGCRDRRGLPASPGMKIGQAVGGASQLPQGQVGAAQQRGGRCWEGSGVSPGQAGPQGPKPGNASQRRGSQLKLSSG